MESASSTSITSASSLNGGMPQRAPERLRGTSLAAVLAALMVTLLLAALDQTIVSTALPTILGDLNGYDRYTWVVTAYLLTSTTVIPIVGKLSDQFGRKWFIVASVVIFLIGSALSGAAQDMNQLIAFRALQGLGAGGLLSLVFTSIGDIFSPAERARWQGLFSGVFALASVVGPTAGGWITDNSSWRWVFYINLPLGLIALGLLIFFLPSTLSLRSSAYRGWAAIRRIDFAGAFSAAAATTCLLLGLTWGGSTYPWNSWQVIAVLVAAGVLFIAFFFIEIRAVEPVLPLDLFRNQVFTSSALLALGVGMGLFAVVIYLPLFLQGVLRVSATNSGVVVTPLTLALASGATAGGFIIARIGRYQWLAILGAIVLTGGIFLLSRMDASTQLLTVTIYMIVVGAGLGMLTPVLTLAVQNAIPRSRLGVGTGAVTYLRALGQTLGTAIIGSIVTNVVSSDLSGRLKTIPNASRLPTKLVNAATNEQVLTNKDRRAQLVNGATHQAVQQAQHSPQAQQAIAQATAHVPAGPAHDPTVAAITQKILAQIATQTTNSVHTLFSQLFDATRLSLAVGIQRAFEVSVFIGLGVLIITFFLKDVPLQSARTAQPDSQANASDEASTAAPDEVVLLPTH
ncbi:MAG: MDR family MFS transporter [Ktedonobacterales bacterium]